MALYDDLRDDFSKILTKLESIRAKQTKLTFSDMIAIFHEVIVDVVHASVVIKDAGPDHKQAIVDASAEFFDNVLIKIKFVQMPDMFKPIVDKFAREIFIELVGKSYDELFKVLETPVLLPPATPPTT